MNKPLRLNIELVPSTAWYDNLRNYVGKENWDIIKKECYRKAGYRCEICKGKGPKWPVECHEIWEYVDNKIILKGLIALCPSCHEVKHIGLASVKGRLDIARKHFMKVNNLSYAEANKHIEDAFKLHQERSKEQWELDLSVLGKYLKNT